MVVAPREGMVRCARRGSERAGRSGKARGRTADHGSGIAINLAPMIDVTFLLLIFFLVTTTFERAEGILSSDLPQGAVTPAVALPISPIVIRLAAAGPEQQERSISIDRFDNVPQSFEELPAFIDRIQQEPGFDKETPVVIVAESGVRWDHVVNCWNAALRAGCESIAFAEP